MTIRTFPFRAAALLLIVAVSSIGRATELRQTPAVKAVQQALPSIVDIHSQKTSFDSDSLFSSGRGRKVNGMGTGIVVDERGFIVTNHHVVNGVDTLQVTTADGGTYDAEVISYDRKHDLAIIKIDSSKPLATMPVGTSSDLMLAESVMAVGNAFGYNRTVTQGIISSLSRDVEVNETQSYENLVQTDASINPGNSGGPLVNMDGEVVGVNVAIRAGAQRIGFAIPIDDARRTIARLLDIEKLNGTYHGVVSRDFKSTQEKKLVVVATESDSPAQRTGLKSGDVIVKAGDVQVVDGADLERAMLAKTVGDDIAVVVQRDGNTETLTLTLGAAPERSGVRGGDVVVQNSKTSVTDKVWSVLGLRLQSLLEKNNTVVSSRYSGGMKVTEVRNGSPAKTHGIRPGDILVGLHVWETVSRDNVAYILDHPKFRSFNPLKFYILRGQETLYGHMNLSSGRGRHTPATASTSQ